jgi:hypothetical protein
MEAGLENVGRSVHYTGYRTSAERDGLSIDIYKSMPTSKGIEILQLAASGKNIPACVAAAELIWVVEYDRLTYYLSKEITQFLLTTKVDFRLYDIPKCMFYAVAPHPSSKIQPCLVDLAKQRMAIHTAAKGGVSTILMTDTGGLKDMLTDPSFGDTPEIRKANYAHTKLAYTLWVYMKAFPELIKDGFPDDMNIRSMRHSKGAKRRSIQLPDKIKRVAPGTHLRQWHLRHLWSDRFKRNPDGTVKVVLVRDTIVNRLNAKTVG